jgi:hypothetical protein
MYFVFTLGALIVRSVLLVWTVCDNSQCVKLCWLLFSFSSTDCSQPGGVEVDVRTVGCRRVRVYGLAGR